MPKSEFGLTYKFAMRHFFDRASIQRQLLATEKRGLSQAGAFIRTRARSLLRRRKAVSQPGQPPSIHSTGAASLKTVLFVFEPASRSVVIGPVKLNQVNQSGLDLRSKSVPEILEFGDVVSIHEKSSDGGKTWRRRDMRRNTRPWEIYRTRRAAYKPRPFMGPAFQQELESGRIAGSFKNSFGPVAV